MLTFVYDVNSRFPNLESWWAFDQALYSDRLSHHHHLAQVVFAHGWRVGCLPFSHEWQNNLQLIPSNTLHINSQRQYREGLTSKAHFISSHKAITFYKNKNLNPGITKILDDLSRSTLVNLPDTRSPKSGIASAFRHPSQYKSFEPRIFGVASDCSTSCATTTALLW